MDGSYRVLSDSRDGALVGALVYGVENSTEFSFNRVSASGEIAGAVSAYRPAGFEIVPRGDGGFFLADFSPSGPYQPYDPDAYIRVTQSLCPPGWTDFFEIHHELVIKWYGDIALASTGDGGAVFFWSQVRDRVGLFARRFTSAGAVSAVEPLRATFGLRSLRFMPGVGVRMLATLPGDHSARIDLFDLAGRVESSQAIDAARGPIELTLAGTANLPSGLYFARITSGAQAISRRAIVTR